ncbi:MAG: M20/M25/M40 family metallo-hydrolase [Actinophytocola sp.]|uniref:M20/M25/M40 family metallo-hydrolase n=1 Tax=Actinophytocola sp. TaxID=1872138 RepID=UPI0013271C6C|nr:M20/M25/M40 family metallo-hydrolase [Actinophytocola sp.]MPZ84873.1 M20/M25/M40 family metallo-hydrolase [Actinophytocola sp.]
MIDLDRVLPTARAALDALVRIPSVSADPTADLRRTAALTATLFRDAGMPEVEILDDIPGGRPAVLARHPAPPGRPTVLLYAHHDVQPAGELAEWTSRPFEPSERDGRLFGRGTADDKSGIAAHLAAVLAHCGRPPVGVTVLVEGEEEISSPTLGALLARHRDRLAADVIVLADAENLELGTPAFTTTLRGTAACVVELRTLETGVHSGSFGGAAPDALTALCRLLATLHDEHGDVAVAGLGTGAVPAFDYPVPRFRAEAGVLDAVTLHGTGSVTERVWARPAVSVLAVDATPVADASNTLAPVAKAKVGMRIAPGDDAVRAGAALAEHLTTHAPWGARVSVTVTEVAQPHCVDTSGWQFAAAGRAYRNAYGRDVIHIGSGGSIPFVGEFAAAFPSAAILITSAGADNDSRAHGADESVHLAEFERACLAEALLLAELGRKSENGSPE